MNTIQAINTWEVQTSTPIQDFNKNIRALVRKSLGHFTCDISLEDGFLEIKVVEVVKNTVANGISNLMTRRTVLALDTTGMVPIEYQGSAEAIGSCKYALSEMVDTLYA